ncbi:hypothetical protein [Homoserinibacter sp. YIM 151385]|uniref:hypothetical protein n=1 Tax=Homoserinibacter sp. YIM 151385 TaxID=2985506 RepID=UPI0022F11C32|nr:hypothetical protein [Homoserinibacter sp. YIM 151385]WBU38527.1 hypothetical protein OF852_02775 [Homoserinibacter sp. YIM 151385]
MRRTVLRSIAAASAVAAIVLGSILVGVIAPPGAVAASRGPLDPGSAWDYMLTIKGAQLYDTNTDAAKAAWTDQYKRQSASSATAYSIGSQYGHFERDELAGVIPINKINEPISKSRYNFGSRIPAFKAKEFFKPTAAGVGALGMAATGFAFRADMANGALSWFGLDGQGMVCADPFFSGGFANFITGQDCDMWAQAAEYEAFVNSDVEAGVNLTLCGLPIRKSNADTVLVQDGCLTRLGPATQGSARIWCFASNYGGPDATAVMHAIQIRWASPGGTTKLTTATPSLGYPQTADTSCRAAHATAKTQFYIGTASESQQFDPVAMRPWVNGTTGPWTEVTDQEADPERTLTCTITLNNGSKIKDTTAPYKESSGSFPEPRCPQVPPEFYPVRTTLTDSEGNVLWDEETSDDFQEYMAEDHQRCTKDRDCVLDLVYKPTGLSCFGMGDKCDGWMLNKADYQCQYGGRNVSIGECHIYAQIFNYQRRVEGRPYADPRDGDEITGTTGSRFDQQLFARPWQDPTKARSCGGGSNFSVNPLDFVFRPVQCALEWAFAPRLSVVQGTNANIGQAWRSTPPGKLIAIVQGWNLSFNVNGCGGFPARFDYGDATVNIGIPSACPGTPLADAASKVRLFSSIATVFGAAFAILRMAGAAIGFNASPGEGKS